MIMFPVVDCAAFHLLLVESAGPQKMRLRRAMLSFYGTLSASRRWASTSDESGSAPTGTAERNARLRPIQWAKMDPVEKLTTIIDCQRAVDALFDDNATVLGGSGVAALPSARTVYPLSADERDTFYSSDLFRQQERLQIHGSPPLASWLGLNMMMWLRVLYDAQDITVRRKTPHAETATSGWGMTAAVLPTKNVERIVDATVWGDLFLTDRGEQFDNVSGRHVEEVVVWRADFSSASSSDANARMMHMTAFAAIATQLFVYGNAVRLITDDCNVAALARHLWSHVIRFNHALVVDEVPQLTGGVASYVSPALLQNTWVLLGSDSPWSSWRVPWLRDRLVHYIAENQPRIVLFEESWAGAAAFRAAVEKLWERHGINHAQHLTWMPVANLEQQWGSITTTHCVTVFASGEQRKAKPFRDALHSRMTPVSWRESPVGSPKDRRGHRSTLGMLVAAETARRSGVPEDLAVMRVIGVNTSAHDVLFAYPQLELSPGRVGNALRFAGAMRSIVQRPFGSANLFSGLGGSVELGSEKLKESRSVLRQERGAELLRRTLPLSFIQYMTARWFGV